MSRIENDIMCEEARMCEHCCCSSSLSLVNKFIASGSAHDERRDIVIMNSNIAL